MKNWQKYEPYFFLAILFINLSPVFSAGYFPTLDGPAHQYNARLITELLFKNNSAVDQFFVLNREPVPNWIGHLLLGFFQQFTTSNVAEKIVLLIYFIGFPLSFRELIKTISPKAIGFSYLIFPFVYSSVLALGFYNFSLALVLLFFTLAFWVKYQHQLWSMRRYIVFSLLLITTYFSHLFVFCLLLLILGILLLTPLIQSFFDRKKDKKQILHTFLKKTTSLLVMAIVPLLLVINYFLKRSTETVKSYLPMDELLLNMKVLGSLIAYNKEKELPYTTLLFWSFVFLFITSCVVFIYRVANKEKNENATNARVWFVVFVVTGFLYFFMPDSDETAGYVSSRLGLLVYLFLIIWLSTLKVPGFAVLLSISLTFFATYQLNTIYKIEIGLLNDVAKEIDLLAKRIPENSIVLPIDQSNHWVLGHFSNYLGIDKPMIILENYEASTGYFPVKWNLNNIPNIELFNANNMHNPCAQKSDTTRNRIRPDFILFLGKKQSDFNACDSLIEQELKANYLVFSQEKYTSVFKYKR